MLGAPSRKSRLNSFCPQVHAVCHLVANCLVTRIHTPVHIWNIHLTAKNPQQKLQNSSKLLEYETLTSTTPVTTPQTHPETQSKKTSRNSVMSSLMRPGPSCGFSSSMATDVGETLKKALWSSCCEVDLKLRCEWMVCSKLHTFTDSMSQTYYLSFAGLQTNMPSSSGCKDKKKL